jgi:hypothetical protein
MTARLRPESRPRSWPRAVGGLEDVAVPPPQQPSTTRSGRKSGKENCAMAGTIPGIPPRRPRPGVSCTRLPGEHPSRRRRGDILTCASRQVSAMKGVSRPVGRVLCARLRGPAVIHLGLPLPAASCGLPASIGRAALERSRRPAPPGAGPFDLAPGGVYRAAAVTCGAGGLLHHRFTLTPRRGDAATRGGLFSVALSRGSPRVGVTDHPALWSPDLPHRAGARRDRPADSPAIQDTPAGPRSGRQNRDGKTAGSRARRPAGRQDGGQTRRRADKTATRQGGGQPGAAGSLRQRTAMSSGLAFRRGTPPAA